MKKILQNEKYLGWLLVGLAFILTFAWALTARMPGGPDEYMRYNVAHYIYQNGSLPRGDAPELIDGTWGISYGFYPILSYMVSAVFMRIVSLFSTSYMSLLYGARMADVMFITISAWMTVEASKRLFHDEKKWLYAALVVFLPEYIFMGTYVNTDSLALMAVSMIVLSWAGSLEEGWTWKNCILLGAGMGICFLSYYNAYGWILWSFFYFCSSALLCTEQPWKERWKFFFSRGFAIAGITMGIAGWWFIRNYFLYDGDILARNACTECAEKYAQDAYRPSVYPTPDKLKWTWKNFFLYQDPGWTHNWVIMVLVSFVGTFGYFNIFLNETVSKIYILFLTVGAAGCAYMLREFYWRQQTVQVIKKKEKGAWIRTATIITTSKWNKKALFNWGMLASMITPVILLIYYAYYNDNQAQGRYILSAVFAVMYFVACGYEKLLDRFVKKEEAKVWIYRITTILWISGVILIYLFLIVPQYKYGLWNKQ